MRIGLTAATSRAAWGVMRAPRQLLCVVGRRGDLRHLDRHVDHHRDGGHDDPHRDGGPQPGQPGGPAAESMAARRGQEALGRQPELAGDPVGHDPQAVRRAQGQPGPHRAQPGSRDRQRAVQPRLDSLQAVCGRLDVVDGRLQSPAQRRFVVMHGAGHASRSSTLRSVAIALAV
jgi:hypothetical protein